MSSSGSGKKSSWPSVGQLHTSVRDAFVSRGWGASTLGKVEADFPGLMGKRATATHMNALVDIENSRVKQGPLVTSGDYLARAATPFRRAVVHSVMANATLGRYGMRGLLEDKNEYGHAVLSDLLSGTF
jgi:hypothetical protein